jgi:hypothetical protein
MSSLLTPGALHRAVADNDTAAAARLLRRGGVAASGRAARADSPSAGAPSAIGAADAVTTPGLDGRSALRLATLLAGRDQILRLMHNAAGPGARVGPHPKPIATMSPPPPLGARLLGARARIADVVGAAAVAPPQCCLHGCSGRGHCQGGACVCEVAWRGVDCGLSAAAVGAAARRCTHGGARARSGIFVSGSTLPVAASVPTPPTLSRYGADARDCAGAAVATIDPGRNDLYTALDVFLLRLLADSDARAPAEACAALTWAPLYGLRLHSNLDGGVWARLAALAASRRRPIAMGAAPRLHEVPLDVGVCGLPQVGE